MKNLCALLQLSLAFLLPWNNSFAQTNPIDSSLVSTQFQPDFRLQTDSITVSSLLFFQQLSPSVYPFLRIQAGNEGQHLAPISFSSFLGTKYSSFSSVPLHSELPAFRPTLTSKWPFSFIEYYQAGASDEAYQKLRVIHARQINPNLIAGFSGGTLSSKGSFVHQEAKLYDFTIWSRYNLNKYSLHVSGVVNSSKNQENGGLESDSLFINQLFDSPKYDLNVNLTDAQLIQQNKSLSILNRLSLDKDSTTSNHTLNWLLFYTQSDRYFSDGGSNEFYYQSLGFDSLINADSAFHKQVGSTIAYQFLTDSSSFLHTMQLSTNYAYQQFRHQVDTFVFHNLDVTIDFELKPFQAFSLKAKACYVLSGWHQHNYQLNAHVQKLFSNRSSITTGIQTERQNPDFLLIQQLSTYYGVDSLSAWVNSFAFVNWSDITDRFQIRVQAGFGSNFWYFQSFDSFHFQENPIMYAEAMASYRTQKKWFQWDSRVLIQVNKLSAYSLPAWQLNTRFAFKGSLFEHKAKFRAGAELFVNDAHYLPFYNPVLSLFGQQSNYEQAIYPLVNVFLLFEIKTAQVYLNYENLTGLLYPENLMIAYQYPFPLPRFGFGINWFAFD
ncbi:MAG: hypothetical protein K9I34_00330 [Bacteroidales bacterium]|nr:hypothetical protein [Bacteroidales bacterium]